MELRPSLLGTISLTIATFISVARTSNMDIIFPPPVPQSLGESKDPPGHLKPFGWQRPPDGPVIEYDQVLPAEEYWKKHIKNRIPCVFRQAVSKSPAIKLWTDEYLKEKYGGLDVLVELKRENRTFSTGRMRLRDFLDRYKKENLYVVSMLPKAMMHEIQAVPNVLCGTFKNFTHESNLWVSNGGTRSVIHYDADHNLHCMLAGRKDMMMIENKYQKWLYMVEREPTSGSGYSTLDPDVIDMYKNPNIAKVPWTWATIYPGDCIYIPGAYLHQVRSYVRSISATTLFTEEVDMTFNNEGCYKELVNEYHTMDDIEFHWTYEFGDPTIDMGYMNVERLRNVLLQHIKEFPKRRWTERGFAAFYKHFTYGGQQEKASYVFKDILKADKKGYIDEDDIRGYSRPQLKVLARAMDPPHGPKTNGTEKVIVRPGDDNKEERELREKGEEYAKKHEEDDEENNEKEDEERQKQEEDDDNEDPEDNERRYEREKELLWKEARGEDGGDEEDSEDKDDDDTEDKDDEESEKDKGDKESEKDQNAAREEDAPSDKKQDTKDEL